MGNVLYQFYTELRKAKALVKKIYTGKRPVDDLPKPMQHFVIKSGILSFGNIHYAKIEWKNIMLKFSKKGNWNRSLVYNTIFFQTQLD